MQDWLLNAFGKAPHVVERILRVFPHDRLDDRIDKDRFTAREVISHLADYEQNVLEAFRIAKTRPGSSRPAYDPDASCATHKYGEKDVYREAEVFESRRMMTLDLLRGFTADDWEGTFVTGEGTLVSAKQYFLAIFAHDMEHLDQLSSYLAVEVATIS